MIQLVNGVDGEGAPCVLVPLLPATFVVLPDDNVGESGLVTPPDVLPKFPVVVGVDQGELPVTFGVVTFGDVGAIRVKTAMIMGTPPQAFQGGVGQLGSREHGLLQDFNVGHYRRTYDVRRPIPRKKRGRPATYAAAVNARADAAMAALNKAMADVPRAVHGNVFDSDDPPPMMPNDVEDLPIPKTARPSQQQTNLQRVLKQKVKRHAEAQDANAAIQVQRAMTVAITGRTSFRQMVATSYPRAREGAEEANKAVAAEDDIGPWPGTANANVSSCVTDPGASWDGMDRSLACQNRLLDDWGPVLASLTGPPLWQQHLAKVYQLGDVRFRPLLLWMDAGSHRICKIRDVPEELEQHVKPGQKKAKCNLLVFRPGDASQPHSEDCRRVLSVDWAQHSFHEAMEASGAWRFCRQRAVPHDRICGAKLCKTHKTVDLNNAKKGVKAVDCPYAGQKQVLVPIVAMDGAELSSIFGKGRFYDEAGNFGMHSVTWKGACCPFHKIYTDPTSFRSAKHSANFEIDADLVDQYRDRAGPDTLRHILQIVWCPDHLCALHVGGAITNTLRWMEQHQSILSIAPDHMLQYLPKQSNLQQSSDNAEGKPKSFHFSAVRGWVFDKVCVSRQSAQQPEFSMFDSFVTALALSGAVGIEGGKQILQMWLEIRHLICLQVAPEQALREYGDRSLQGAEIRRAGTFIHKMADEAFGGMTGRVWRVSDHSWVCHTWEWHAKVLPLSVLRSEGDEHLHHTLEMLWKVDPRFIRPGATTSTASKFLASQRIASKMAIQKMEAQAAGMLGPRVTKQMLRLPRAKETKVPAPLQTQQASRLRDLQQVGDAKAYLSHVCILRGISRAGICNRRQVGVMAHGNTCPRCCDARTCCGL